MDKKAKKVVNFDDDHFWYPSYFQVVDVNILKKADGRMVGCAFVEFKKVTEATNALKDLNSSQMLGRLVIKQIQSRPRVKTLFRTIAVDWAVPKEVFNDKKKEEGVKEETVVKEEIKEEAETVEEEEDEDNERVSEWIKE